MAKKLIEVAIPLDEINEASAREKSIRHGHPSTLHLWWARRPLATARAVLFASLIDDPSERKDLYPTKDDQNQRRQELFDLIERMVQWENSSDENVLNEVRAEIKKAVGNPPEVLDPFAGGGTIPLEAQRLGLRAHAADLNPVAVLINKAMIELPFNFKDRPPVNPDAQKNFANGVDWHGAHGLAVDVEYYGRRLKNLAAERIGDLYPTVKLDDGSEATVIAWIWTRTVKCNNPACLKIFPLAHSFVLSKKQNISVKPILEGDQFRFEIAKDEAPVEGTISRSGGRCIHCGANVKFEHIRAEARAGRLGVRLMAIVAEGKGERIYLEPNDEHVKAADVEPPEDSIDAPLPEKALGFAIQNYGVKNYNQMFTARQLTALTTFSDLSFDVRAEVMSDCGDKNYADAVATYLALLVDKLAMYHSSNCIWHSGRDIPVHVFGRQALSAVWDYAEANPFSGSAGCFDNMLDWIIKCLRELPTTSEGEAHQHDAAKTFEQKKILISTDPPYYDNVPYSDLSDFFYAWLRRSIKKIYPRLLMKMITPKAEELIADPHRHDSKAAARNFFENGMRTALKNIYDSSTVDFPTTIYYAYKQDDSKVDDEQLSSGWETMLRAIIDAGFIITGTWPMRTELTTALKGKKNALSTSVVIVCRKPPKPKEPISYNLFINEVMFKLGSKLENLQLSNLSPVDMAQAAIGPGMELYSKYSMVQRGDGRVMDIRSALRLINKVLDEFLNSQDTELDNESKFCIDLYKQVGFDEIKFGEAQLLATAKNVSPARMRDMGIIESGRGFVRLLRREELKDHIDNVWALMQRAVWWEIEEGAEECVKRLLIDHEGKIEPMKRLAYRVYNIADVQGNASEAQRYDRLIEAWEYLMECLIKEKIRRQNEQMKLGLEEE